MGVALRCNYVFALSKKIRSLSATEMVRYWTLSHRLHLLNKLTRTLLMSEIYGNVFGCIILLYKLQAARPDHHNIPYRVE